MTEARSKRRILPLIFIVKSYSMMSWEILVCETSHYYEQQKAPYPNQHKSSYHPVTKEEIQAFVGILILIEV